MENPREVRELSQDGFSTSSTSSTGTAATNLIVLIQPFWILGMALGLFPPNLLSHIRGYVLETNFRLFKMIYKNIYGGW